MTSMLATSSVADRPQMDSSAIWPMLEVVSTEYQEHTSATAISGTTAREAKRPSGLPVAREASRSMMAHWAAKQSSAQVATERPTMTLDTHEFTSTRRGMSNTGKEERKAHPKT